MSDGNLPEGVFDDKYCKGNCPAPRGTPGCTEPSPKAWGSYFGFGKAYPKLGRNRAYGSASSRQTCSFGSRTQENFSGPESTLGQDQTDEKSSLNAGRAAGCVKTSSRETEARRISAQTEGLSNSYQGIAQRYAQMFRNHTLGARYLRHARRHGLIGISLTPRTASCAPHRVRARCCQQMPWRRQTTSGCYRDSKADYQYRRSRDSCCA